MSKLKTPSTIFGPISQFLNVQLIRTDNTFSLYKLKKTLNIIFEVKCTFKSDGDEGMEELRHPTEGRLQFPSDRRCLPEASWPEHVSWPAGRPEKPFYWFQHRILECADCRSPCSPSSIVRPPLAEMPANGTCQSLLDQRSKCDQHLSLWTEKIIYEHVLKSIIDKYKLICL